MKKNTKILALGILAVALGAVVFFSQHGGTSLQGKLIVPLPGPTQPRPIPPISTTYRPRSIPAVKLEPLGVSNLPGSANTTILAMSISAAGQDDVSFSKANNNHIIVNLNGAGPSNFSCTLLNGQTNMNLDTVSGGFGPRVFSFAISDLSINPGTSTLLQLNCDMTGFTTIGDSVQASLASSPSTIQWSDGFQKNINTELIIKSTFFGPTFVTP